MNLSFLERSRSFFKILSSVEIKKSNSDLDFLSIENAIEFIHEKLSNLREQSNHLYIVGNGGSAGVAAHAVTDFFNVAQIRATTLHESSLLTCMANDFGYENAVARMLTQLLMPGDVVIAISSSGNSMNMRNAAISATRSGAFVITLTGFDSNNPLRQLGDVNIWLDSRDYGFVEIGHQFILHNIADRFNKKLTV